MNSQKATLAAGCFWGVQYYFDQVPGVLKTTAGYTGGHTTNPTYEEVCSHTTGHAEAVEIEFDSEKLSYETLLKHFFRMHDPTQLNRQGPDIGDSYRSAIFYHNQKQKELSEKILDQTKPNFKNKIVTDIVSAKEFYPAEDNHQKFTERTGQGMCRIPYQPIG